MAPSINLPLFEFQFEEFKEFVELKSGVPFFSFSSHPYTLENEGFKKALHETARAHLSCESWNRADCGKGNIARSVLAAIEFPRNNLVQWQGRFGDEMRPQQPIHVAVEQGTNLQGIEKSLFTLYRENDDARAFSELVGFFGKKYGFLAYLFFLKDQTKYLPIAPTYFDNTFKLLGVDFRTKHRCSWENYHQFLSFIGEIKKLLSERLGQAIELIDAHSFAWILSCQMQTSVAPSELEWFQTAETSERDAVIRARVGQGRFRQSLIEYWQGCAVTGCREISLLRASHIKPWANSSLLDRLNPFNGLLLTPGLDACFDRGYVGFDEKGNLLRSTRFGENDYAVLGIPQKGKLRLLDQRHQNFLKYHREKIFR